jgi:hypothetical protein
LWIEIAEKRYPEEFWDLDFDNNYYVLAYDAFQDFKRIFIKTDSIPYIDKKGFKSMYPIYSIDLSDQPENMPGTKSDIVMKLQKFWKIFHFIHVLGLVTTLIHCETRKC